MLGTRILTAVVLIPSTLAARCWRSPRGWGAVPLGVVVIAAMEWADLAAYPRVTWVLFVGVTGLIGLYLLFVPASGFAPQGGGPGAIPLWVCGAATLFWALLAPPWLASGWHPESKLVLAVTGWLILIPALGGVGPIHARSPGAAL